MPRANSEQTETSASPHSSDGLCLGALQSIFLSGLFGTPTFQKGCYHRKPVFLSVWCACVCTFKYACELGVGWGGTRGA